jgi:hypothetical protein
MGAILWGRRGLVVVLMLLVGGIYYPLVQQAWWLNIGLVEINRGLMNRQEESVIRGQKALSHLLPSERNSPYRSIAEAELDPDNLLVNGGFEFNGHGWVLSGPGGVLPMWTSDKAHSGLQSLVIPFDGGDVNFHHTYQEVPVQPDTCYRLEVWIRAEGLTDGVGLDVWDAERGYQYWYGGQTPLVGGTAEWTPGAREFCTGDDVTRIQIRLRRYGGEGQGVSGTAWFDDIRLEPLSP